MQIERRALYNLLLQNWYLDKNAELLPWQVEDYRNLPLEEIFQRLTTLDLPLDSNTFLAFAEQSESPEDLTDQILWDGADVFVQDQIYLLLFELWRRLAFHRPCLSIFCDELDHQVHLYDRGEDGANLQNRLVELQKLLEKNVDQGLPPLELFRTICQGCANDIETFLYDYICEQLEECNFHYAADCIEGFYPYVADNKWFDFLYVKLLIETGSSDSDDLFKELLTKELDVEFCLELLSYMLQQKRYTHFSSLAKQTLPLLEIEEDLIELLELCADFYDCLGDKKRGEFVRKIFSQEKRGASFIQKDSRMKKLWEILERRST